LQEATEEMADLPALVGGYFFREPLEGRIYGLAVWSPHPLLRPYALRLPVSQVPGRVPPRVAQIVHLGDVAFANVHLSHGQFLNRWQLVHIANALDGPAAIVGDYNAVGPIKLAGFKDVGPRQSTHSPNDIISFRLDRCMARGLRCSYARVLARGSSDHHPISLKLHTLPGVQVSDGPVTAHVRRPTFRVQMLWNVDVRSFLNGGHSSRRRSGPLCATTEVTKHVSKGHLSSSGLMQHKKAPDGAGA
jgi:hypothetical protein